MLAALVMISTSSAILAVPARAQGSPAADAVFTRLRDQYFLWVLDRDPVTSTYLGGDGYSDRLKGVNGRLRNYTPEALRREAQFYHGLQTHLRGIDPASLSPDASVDYPVMRAQVAFLLHQIEELRSHERAVETYVVERGAHGRPLQPGRAAG
jgi:hypothetical protein